MEAEVTSDSSLDPALGARLARLLGSAPISARAVAGGYSPARRFVVRLANGASVFVKAATTPGTEQALLVEHRVYETLRGGFLPRCLAVDASPPAVLVLEDLSNAHWPPPWRAGDVEAVLAALAAIHGTAAPAWCPRLAEAQTMRTGWARVEADPRPFLSLGMADDAWLEAALPALRKAEADAPLDGEALLHLDVRSDNVALSGGHAFLLDWSWATIGNADVDLAFWMPSLAMEGGPRPSDVYRGDLRLTAVVSGWFASSAGLPPPPRAPRVRAVQRRQLEAALPWAAEALGLRPPAGR